MMKSSIKAFSSLLCLMAITALTGASIPLVAARAEEPQSPALRVVTTIAPLYALTAGVMDGVGTPHLLLQPGDTPHHFTMKPSAAQKVVSSDMLICTSKASEPYLQALMKALPERETVVIEALSIPGMELVDSIVTDEGHAHADVNVDMHFWLNPRNAIAYTQYIAEELSSLAPHHAATFSDNAAKQVEKLQKLDAELADILGAAEGKTLIARYASYHASLRYFEARYHIRGGKAITRTPEAGASVEEGERLHAAVEAGELACLLDEPEFSSRLLKDVAARFADKTRVITVDTLGAQYPAEAASYFTMMHALADALSGCIEKVPEDD